MSAFSAQCRFVESSVVDPTIEGIAPIGAKRNPKQAVVHGNRTGLVLRTRQNAVEVSFEFYSIVCGYEKMPVVRGNGIESIVDVGSQKPIKGSALLHRSLLEQKRRSTALPLGKNLRPIRRRSVWLEPKGIGKPDSSLQVGMWTGVRVTSPELKSKPPTDLPVAPKCAGTQAGVHTVHGSIGCSVPLDSSKVQLWTSNSSLRTTASETVIWKIQMKANTKKGKRRDINDLI